MQITKNWISMYWPQLIAHIITPTVENGQICNMYNNNMCDPHKHQELCLLCCTTPGIASDLHASLPGVVQSVLLTPTR